MTINEVKNIITATANEYGFQTSESAFSRLPIIESEELNFSLLERHDGDWEACKVTVHIEAAASVRKMGGSPTVEELLKTAEEIKRGAELVAKLQSLELAFTETF